MGLGPCAPCHRLAPSPPPLIGRCRPLRHAAKADRLKQAKDEAEKEVAAYKAERETEFQRKLVTVRELGVGGLGCAGALASRRCSTTSSQELLPESKMMLLGRATCSQVCCCCAHTLCPAPARRTRAARRRMWCGWGRSRRVL